MNADTAPVASTTAPTQEEIQTKRQALMADIRKRVQKASADLGRNASIKVLVPDMDVFLMQGQLDLKTIKDMSENLGMEMIPQRHELIFAPRESRV